MPDKKEILILGAGRSAPYLIQRLLDESEKNNWHVTLADADEEVAQQRINGHPCGTAIQIDATNEEQMAAEIAKADIVANVLAPRFQATVARHCVQGRAHMVSVSYLSEETHELNSWASDRGVLLLGEMGLDPGIDHMMAAEAIRATVKRGGKIRTFRSFGSGVPAPDSPSNPLKYLVTWNPWNVATSGSSGAQYLLRNDIRIVPQERLFLHTWRVEVDGVGVLEGYPNRDSLGYLDHFDLEGVHTMVRGTLRHLGFCETWNKVVQLGMPNTTINIPDLCNRSPREVVAMFLPLPIDFDYVEDATALFLELNPTGHVIEQMRFLGLFDDAPSGCSCTGTTAADMLAHLLETRLAPPEGSRDMVILVHEMEVEYPEEDRMERVTYTLVEYGDPHTISAMAKTVGLPTSLAIEMILKGELDLVGCQMPIHPEICDPVLAQLRAEGLNFTEKVEVIPRESSS